MNIYVLFLIFFGSFYVIICLYLFRVSFRYGKIEIICNLLVNNVKLFFKVFRLLR